MTASSLEEQARKIMVENLDPDILEQLRNSYDGMKKIEGDVKLSRQSQKIQLEKIKELRDQFYESFQIWKELPVECHHAMAWFAHATRRSWACDLDLTKEGSVPVEQIGERISTTVRELYVLFDDASEIWENPGGRPKLLALRHLVETPIPIFKARLGEEPTYSPHGSKFVHYVENVLIEIDESAIYQVRHCVKTVLSDRRKKFN